MNILASNNSYANSTYVARTPKISQAEVEASPADKVTFGGGEAAEGFLVGGLAGAQLLGTIGAFVGEPVGLVGGIIYGVNNAITGNKIADAVIGGVVGAVAGPIALGLGGAVVGGLGGSIIGGVAGALS